MNLFDLHCDTAFEMFKQRAHLYENELDISLARAESAFSQYSQVMAIWTDSHKSDENCWEDFLAVRKNLALEAEKSSARICVSADEAKTAQKQGKSVLFLGVEGARILSGNLDRVDEIYKLGVRFLTLQWKGSDIIGGAYDTDLPLTDFGREVIKRCAELGIIIDVSHSSRKVTAECLEFADCNGCPVAATHSNSFAVARHERNLTDEEAKAVAACGGVIGISLAPMHLNLSGKADISDIIKHISHYFDIGVGKALCLGCDFDGISVKPQGIEGISDLPLIASAMRKYGFAESDIENVFWKNAADFAVRFL